MGDEVLLQQRKQDKFTTQFEPQPYKVVDRTGTQVTVQSQDGVTYKRNLAHTKRYVRPEQTNDDKQPSITKDTFLTEDTGSHSTDTPIPDIRTPTRTKRTPERLKDYVVGHVQFR